jgi:FkbM family methyltransferase
VKAITHSSFYLADDTFEPRFRRLFLALLKKIPPRSIFFDIGANVGLYTWLAAGMRNDLKIIAFEPDPENFRLLTKTAQAWQSDNVRLYQMALSDDCGSATFERDEITSATGSLAQGGSFAEKHFNTLGEKIRVQTTTLDIVASEEGMPAIIKIDVEGHEAKVFAGASHTIQKACPVIFFERWGPVSDIPKLSQCEYILFDADHGGVPNARTRNYVAVRAGSPLEMVVREHLSAGD